jgi:hypothetical protein
VDDVVESAGERRALPPASVSENAQAVTAGAQRCEPKAVIEVEAVSRQRWFLPCNDELVSTDRDQESASAFMGTEEFDETVAISLER